MFEFACIAGRHAAFVYQATRQQHIQIPLHLLGIGFTLCFQGGELERSTQHCGLLRQCARRPQMVEARRQCVTQGHWDLDIVRSTRIEHRSRQLFNEQGDAVGTFDNVRHGFSGQLAGDMRCQRAAILFAQVIE